VPRCASAVVRRFDPALGDVDRDGSRPGSSDFELFLEFRP
jgi:hypothetical protein